MKTEDFIASDIHSISDLSNQTLTELSGAFALTKTSMKREQNNKHCLLALVDK